VADGGEDEFDCDAIFTAWAKIRSVPRLTFASSGCVASCFAHANPLLLILRPHTGHVLLPSHLPLPIVLLQCFFLVRDPVVTEPPLLVVTSFALAVFVLANVVAAVQAVEAHAIRREH
jgi:hypothetical protein